MSELKLTGNCLKGSRPVLSFDQVMYCSTVCHETFKTENYKKTFLICNCKMHTLVFKKHTSMVVQKFAKTMEVFYLERYMVNGTYFVSYVINLL